MAIEAVVATYSIVACDLDRAQWGVATQSKFLAVGAVVPWARAGIGAVATQAFANVAYGPEGLAHLAGGASASAALDKLVAADSLRDQRQAGIVDAHAGAATHTGQHCFAWAGGRAGAGFAAQRNILVGAAGWINPFIAALLHNLSTVAVVLNSSRLIRYRDPGAPRARLALPPATGSPAPLSEPRGSRVDAETDD